MKLKGPKVMRVLARHYADLQFVQIGSNDGRKHDPIHQTVMQQTAWRGVLIEPVPYVFKRLQKTYAGQERFALENVAISKHDGMADFYHLREAEDRTGLPDWYDELGSFYKDVLLKHKAAIPDIETRLQVTQVPCARFETVCQRHGIDQVGLLHIDTEGYDYEIIKSIDFEQYRPKVLIYEHKHLQPSEREDCQAYLSSLGYLCFSEQQDTWCVDTQVSQNREQAWLTQTQRLLT